MTAGTNKNLNKIKTTNDNKNKSTKLNETIAVNLSNRFYIKETTNTDATCCNNVPYDKKNYKKKRNLEKTSNNECLEKLQINDDFNE